MIVLDTDILSVLDYEHGEAFGHLTHRLARPENRRVCVTIISFEEQMRGWLSYIASSRLLQRQIDGYRRLELMLKAYSMRELLPFDSHAAANFERLRAARIRIGTMDLKIAAICLAQKALLISRNTADFRRVPDLRVEDWTLPH